MAKGTYSKSTGMPGENPNSSEYSKVFVVETQDQMRHNILPSAAAKAAQDLRDAKKNGSIRKGGAREFYLSRLKYWFKVLKAETPTM